VLIFYLSNHESGLEFLIIIVRVFAFRLTETSSNGEATALRNLTFIVEQINDPCLKYLSYIRQSECHTVELHNCVGSVRLLYIILVTREDD
jgi:hypothetical protein